MSTKLLPLVAVLVCFTCQVSASTATTTAATTTAQNAGTTKTASAVTGMTTTTAATLSSAAATGVSSPTTTTSASVVTTTTATATTTVTPAPTTTAGNETTGNGTTGSPTNETTEMPSANSTEAETTTAEMTTKEMPTTTAAASDYVKHRTETALFSLRLTLGPTNTSSDMQYKDKNMTEANLLEKLKEIFGAVSSSVRLERSMEEGEYTLVLEFLVSRIDNKTKETIEAKLTALNTADFSVYDLNMTLAKVEKFFAETNDICQATNVCPLGFTCNATGCEHMCKMEDCNMHGTCVVRVFANESVGVMCNCDITYDTEYEGEHCENSRRGKEQIIAIVAGVLGAACGLLLIILIIIIIVYITSKRKQRNIVLQSDEYFSSTYHNTPIGTENHGMKKMNGVDLDEY